MKTRFTTAVITIGSLAVLAVTGLLRPTPAEVSAAASQPSEEYPKPRYPKYMLKASAEELLPAARIAARQTSGRTPLGKIQSGQTIHVFLPYGQEMNIWEAIRRAMEERGVKAIAHGNWELMGMTKEKFNEHVKKNLVYGGEAWQEMGIFRPEYQQYFSPSVQKEFSKAFTSQVLRGDLSGYLDRRPEIQLFFAGTGGGSFWRRGAGEKHAHKFIGNWTYWSASDLLSKGPEFPSDLWNLVEDKIKEPIPHVSEVTFRDPEGTRLQFVLTPEQSREWTKRSGSSNHLYVYPSPVFSTLKEGVIRAGSNHTGFYPAMTVQLDQYGRVAKIDGGGKTGKLFSALVNHPKLKNAKFPTAPAPGYWYLAQDGFATNPKFLRDYELLVKGSPNLANDRERNRAGVQHFSFTYPGGTDLPKDPRDREYAAKEGLPLEHTAHMHNYFPTVRWKLRDTEEWISIAEKGYVKTFDDAEVRALAAQYGDPESVLRYEWIPSIPGINVSGSYEKDYAPDTWKWVMQEWTRIKSGKYSSYVEDYPALRSGQ